MDKVPRVDVFHNYDDDDGSAPEFLLIMHKMTLKNGEMLTLDESPRGKHFSVYWNMRDSPRTLSSRDMYELLRTVEILKITIRLTNDIKIELNKDDPPEKIAGIGDAMHRHRAVSITVYFEN